MINLCAYRHCGWPLPAEYLQARYSDVVVGARCPNVDAQRVHRHRRKDSTSMQLQCQRAIWSVHSKNRNMSINDSMKLA